MAYSFPEKVSALDVRYGNDAELDALLLHFMTENNLEHSIDPQKNASGEQIRFAVALHDGDFYAPCSDWMFMQLLKSELPPELKREYAKQWERFEQLVEKFIDNSYTKTRLLTLGRHKYDMAIDGRILIPSRLMKRLLTIFITQSGIEDPYRLERQQQNSRAFDLIMSKAFDSYLNEIPEGFEPGRIDAMQREIRLVQLERLLQLSVHSELCSADNNGDSDFMLEDLKNEGPMCFPALREALESDGPQKILYMPSSSGELILDIQVIRALLRMGHRVILALNEGFYFNSPTVWDHEHDDKLHEMLDGAHFVTESSLSKNELLQRVKENPFLVISTGMRERFNPYRMGVTFSRAWKEVDFIISKGHSHHRRFAQTQHQFTRDIFSLYCDKSKKMTFSHIPKAKWAKKFTDAYIRSKADEIIAEMREAKAAGHAVMFYSGVIGSVPGQVDNAIKVMKAFVKDLRDRLDSVYIINPAEHFEEGMDADDLMYMWERVQRSGYITVWRFQSVADIEKSFELLGERVPPVWAGKDSTYSTGCTKEMNIALDVQRGNRELQILGPAPEKFFRRREYGVGKFCDAAIDDCA
ncbi:MAG: ARMT1-like domain-containing protein [Desulfovibrio sp.]